VNKKLIFAILSILIFNVPLAMVTAGPDHGVRIKDGLLTYSASHYLTITAGEPVPLELGFDAWGYNYHAHMFEGSYANAYLGGAGFPAYEGDDTAYLAENPTVVNHWAWPYRNIRLIMKWDDAWLANADKDNDGVLDRHYGFGSYIGSSAWLTNHMSGDDGNGGTWTYFTKIVAAPADATLTNGVWYGADGTEIGPVIWGSFATIQEVESGVGVTYLSPSGPGFGQF
jgi:hypothetical protein